MAKGVQGVHPALENLLPQHPIYIGNTTLTVRLAPSFSASPIRISPNLRAPAGFATSLAYSCEYFAFSKQNRMKSMTFTERVLSGDVLR